MRYRLSLDSDTFTAAKEDFDRLLLATLNKMRKQDISEGSVCLKIDIALYKQFPVDENGERQELYVPKFAHVVQAAISMKDKVKGKLDGDFVLEVRGGMPELFDRDSDTLFDREEAP